MLAFPASDRPAHDGTGPPHRVCALLSSRYGPSGSGRMRGAQIIVSGIATSVQEQRFRSNASTGSNFHHGEEAIKASSMDVHSR